MVLDAFAGMFLDTCSRSLMVNSIGIYQCVFDGIPVRQLCGAPHHDSWWEDMYASACIVLHKLVCTFLIFAQYLSTI